MSIWFILLAMIFLHIIDDYCLQASCLCNLKQKSWWKDNAPDKLYRFDYIWALLMHSFSWSFMIMLPIALFNNFEVNWAFGVLLVFNMAIHAFIDDLKANKRMINLWTDQFCHMVQIAGTFYAFAVGGI